MDRLLASPRYGERWGRHWLDAAGYAESDGGDGGDPVRPEFFRYRDYVIRSFNTDKPYDRFLLEQLAGDELNACPGPPLPALERQPDRHRIPADGRRPHGPACA